MSLEIGERICGDGGLIWGFFGVFGFSELVCWSLVAFGVAFGIF